MSTAYFLTTPEAVMVLLSHAKGEIEHLAPLFCGRAPQPDCRVCAAIEKLESAVSGEEDDDKAPRL